MKSFLRLGTTMLVAALVAIAFVGIARADDTGTAKSKPAPVIIRFKAHSMHANDFMVRRSKDRSLESEIQKKGLDIAFTEWMQRDHPFIFAKECIKQVGEMSKEFKSTTHMVDFDTLLTKRADLRLSAEKYGHEVAFAEWLRKERPEVYRQHFGLDKNNMPVKKSGKSDNKSSEKESGNKEKP